jgi:hypothetical protein
VISYRKTPQLRLKRSSSPEPPYWQATAIAPYGGRRSVPIAIDFLDLRASATEKLEVTVCEQVTDELRRLSSKQLLPEPLLIEATEFAELVFHAGEEALRFAGTQHQAALHLVSTRGMLPSKTPAGATVVIATWPLESERIEELFAGAAAQELQWGAAVPVIFPVTTNLASLAELASLARQYGARFLASLPIDSDPTARQSLAQSLTLGEDDETWDLLFHSDLEPLQVATERHIAALADEHGMQDFIVPPRWDEKSNWNAAVVLTLAAARMLAMGTDVELAGTLARSARRVAELEKPLARIAEAASLSIIESLDEVSVNILTEWLVSGRSSFAETINREWRLRRDAGM